MRKLCLLFVCAAAHVLATTTPVQITDHLASAVWGYSVQGSLTICNPAMIEPDGTSVPSGCQTVPVNNGLVSVALLPTAGATVNGVAGTANYSVTYSIGNHANVQELWAVPVSGAVLTISKVVIPAPGELRPPFGSALPTTCKQGDLFLNTADANLYLCNDGSNDWTQLATGAQAHSLYLQTPTSNGIIYSSGAGVTRNATGSDVTTTLGYNPMSGANNLSELSSAAAGRTNLGILDAATHAATDFVLSSAVGSSIATLTAGKVPASQLPNVSTLSGQLPLSQVQTTGTPTGTTALFGDGAWKTIPYSVISGTPTIPTDLAGFTNGPGFALNSSISTVGHSGAYSDLAGKPSYGTAATHDLADFVLTSQIGVNSGVTPLDAGGHVALALLPTIPSTQVSGLGTAATTNASAYLTTASLGTANGPIQSDSAGKLPSAALPTIAYSSLSGLPTIPTDNASLANGAGYARTSSLAAVALSGSYTDLSNKPSLAFDASGAAAAVQAGDLQKSNNLSDLASISIAKTNLGLTSVASTGAYGDLAGRPTLAAVATSGAYGDLSGRPTIPSAYTLPAATGTTLGGVICGANLTCATDGTIAAQSPYVLPNASSSVLGGILLGNGLLSNSTTHVVSVDTSLFDAAGAATTAGAGKLVAASNLADLTSATTAKTNLGLSPVATTGAYSDLSGKPTIPAAYTLSAATGTTLGGIICGANTTCAVDGTLSVPAPYTLPYASNSVNGGIILGSGLLSNNSTHAVSVDATQFDAAGAATSAAAGKLTASLNLGDLTSASTAKTNLGLSTVATTGAYGDLSGRPTIPAAYTLPAATGTTLGGVICGANITCAVDGTLSIAAPYSLPQATTSVMGGIVIGNGLLINNTTHAASVDTSLFDAAGAATAAGAGKLVAANNLSDVTNAATSRTNLGISTVGNTGSYTDLTNKPTIPAAYTLPPASSTTLGGVKCSGNINCAVDGTISETVGPYTLPIATPSVLGGVIVGGSLLINSTTGVLSVDTSQFATPASVTAISTGRLLSANNLSDLASASISKTNLGLSTVATTGAYSDLSGKPTIPAAYTLPAATGTTLGGVICGANLTCAVDGTIAAQAPYSLPYASTSVNGGVILGGGLLSNSTTHVVSVDSSLFDAAGAATAASAGKLVAASNLADLTSVSTAKTNLGLSVVATTGQYSDLGGKPTIPAAYTLPAATGTTLGGIIAGANLTVANDGTLSAPAPYSLPYASTTVNGGIILGGGLVSNSTTHAVSVDSTLFDAAGAAATAGAGKLIAANNLSDVTNAATSRTNLGLSTVANTGSYTDLTNKPAIPAAYVEPAATSTTLGGIKCGTNTTCAVDGTLSVPNAYTLPIATASTLGGVVVGSNLTINSSTGALGVNASAFDAAGAATTAAAGKLTASLNLSDLASASISRTNLGLSTVAASGAYSDLSGLPTIPTAYSLPVASSTVLGGVKCGTNVTCAVDGTISAANAYTLPTATASVLGGVIVGTTLTINSGTSVLNVNSSLFDAAGAATSAVAGRLVAANNLSDVTSASASRTNLGLSTVAATGAYSDLTGAPVLGTSATHPAGDFLATTSLGTANGPASLDGTGHLTGAQLPTSIASTVITGLGTASTHPATDFVLATAVGAASGVATLNSSSVLTASQLPAITYGSLVGAPTLATVATSGSYADLSNKPTGFAPTGSAGGDLGGTYPNPSVTAINGQNLVALGAGIIKLNGSGVPAIASGADIRAGIGYTPLNAASNLSDVASASASRTSLGLGSIATQASSSVLADTGSTGIVVRGATAGSTQLATSTDITNTLGYAPINGSTIGAANGLATLDGTSHLTAAQLPAVPYASVTGVPSFVLTSAVGVSVAPLVSGLVPATYLPARPAATTTTLGEVIVGTNLLVTGGGTLSVNASAFDAAGAASTATAGALQKASNLGDLASISVSKTNLGLSNLATSGAWTDISGKPSFATVATSGSYTDLSNKPTIPTVLSAFTNDVPFLTTGTLPVATATAQGIMQPGNFLTVTGGVVSVLTGNTSSTVARGDDTRLVGALQSSLLGASNGIAQLDASGHLPSAQLPSSINASQISGLGTIATHNTSEYVASTLVGAISGVAGLDSGQHVPLAQLPTIPYTQISGGPTAYNLPVATSSVLGGVQIGTGLTATSGGVLSVSFGSGSGQALAGNLLGAASGVAQLDSSAHVSTSQLPIAGPSTAGIMQVGSGLTVTGGSVAVSFGSGANQAINASLINAANGIAGLDASGLIPVAKIPTGISAASIAAGTVSDAEFGYIGTLTSDAQIQINQLAAILGATQPDALLSTFTTALGSVATTPVNVVVFGDSISTCYNGRDGSNNPVCPSTAANRWTDKFATYAKSKYGDHGTGLITVDHGGINAAFWSTSATYGTSSLSGDGQGNPNTGVQLVDLRGGIVLTSTSMNADNIYIYCMSGPDAGSLAITIDGVTSGTACAYNASIVNLRVAFPVTLGLHTVVVTGPSSTSTGGYIYGAEWSVGTSGVAVHNVARSGARSEWYAPGSKIGFVETIPNVKLAIIAIGSNDYLMGTTGTTNTAPSNTQSNINALVTEIKANLGNPAILIVGEPPTGAWGTTTGTVNQVGYNQAAYITAAHTVATNQSVDWASWFDRYNQDPAYTISQGIINNYDKIHPTDTGAADMALMIEKAAFGSSGVAQSSGGGSGSSSTINAGSSSFIVNTTGSPAIQVNEASTAGIALSLANSSGHTWNFGANGSGSSGAPNAFIFYDATTSTTPFTISPTGGNSGTTYAVMLNSTSNFGWASNQYAATNSTLDAWFARATSGISLNSSSTADTQLVLGNTNATGYHTWAVQSSASTDTYGAGKFKIYDTTASADGIVMFNNGGTNYDISVTSGTLLTWASSTTNALSIDTWLGRQGAGMLTVGSTGLGSLSIAAYNSASIPTATATTCSVGQIKSDGSYLYLCNTANHYVRVAVSTF